MKYLKYIIIFTLLLLLGLLYLQLHNYQNITTTLLSKNHTLNQNKIDLQDKIVSLKEQIDKQNEKINTFQKNIISLEENLSLLKLKVVDTNYTQPQSDLNLSNEILKSNKYNDFKKVEKNTTNSSNIKPNITMDNENKITGFGLEYHQKF